jgi:hypothetical protein
VGDGGEGWEMEERCGRWRRGVGDGGEVMEERCGTVPGWRGGVVLYLGAGAALAERSLSLAWAILPSRKAYPA